MCELTATTKRRKVTERDNSIKSKLKQAKDACLAKAREQAATLYTRDKAVMRKLDTLVADYPNTYKLTGQDEVSKTYSFPKSYVSYRKPRAVSTEQRERARQMMIAKNKAKGD